MTSLFIVRSSLQLFLYLPASFSFFSGIPFPLPPFLRWNVLREQFVAKHFICLKGGEEEKEEELRRGV